MHHSFTNDDVYRTHYYRMRSQSRSRSVSREPSVARDLYASHTNTNNTYNRRRLSSVTRDCTDTQLRLDYARKDFHNLQGSFLGRKLEDKVTFYGIQDHVGDQEVQLNRILRLLNQEEYWKSRYGHLYSRKHTGSRLGRVGYTPSSLYSGVSFTGRRSKAASEPRHILDEESINRKYEAIKPKYTFDKNINLNSPFNYLNVPKHHVHSPLRDSTSQNKSRESSFEDIEVVMNKQRERLNNIQQQRNRGDSLDKELELRSNKGKRLVSDDESPLEDQQQKSDSEKLSGQIANNGQDSNNNDSTLTNRQESNGQSVEVENNNENKNAAITSNQAVAGSSSESIVSSADEDNQQPTASNENANSENDGSNADTNKQAASNASAGNNEDQNELQNGFNSNETNEVALDASVAKSNDQQAQESASNGVNSVDSSENQNASDSTNDPNADSNNENKAQNSSASEENKAVENDSVQLGSESGENSLGDGEATVDADGNQSASNANNAAEGGSSNDNQKGSTDANESQNGNNDDSNNQKDSSEDNAVVNQENSTSQESSATDSNVDKSNETDANVDANAVAQNETENSNEQPEPIEPPKPKRKPLSASDINDRIDATVGEVLQHFIQQAAHREDIKENVSSSLQSAIHDVITNVLETEFEENEESGFGVVEYDNLEVYRGPTRLMDLLSHVNIESQSVLVDETHNGNGDGVERMNRKLKAEEEMQNEASQKHGEIIIKVPKGHKVTVRATPENDTIINNIFDAEVIIRNIDTDLTLSILHDNFAKLKHGEFVEMSIVGQAYIRDLTGILKIDQFKGIIVIKTQA